MSEPNKVEQSEARHGQKMIEVKVRFWTDDIAETEGHVVAKNAWTAGVVRIGTHASHGIKPERPVPSNSMGEIPAALEKVLIQHGIKLHPTHRMRHYLAD